MRDDSVIEAMGELGERVVQTHFNSTRSEYKYDEEKDGMIGDETYQVKTIRLNNYTQSFWIGNNKTQRLWENLNNVDRLFFVRIPERENELAILYECVDHNNKWIIKKRNNGVPVRAYPLENCVELTKLTPEQSDYLRLQSIKSSKHPRYV